MTNYGALAILALPGIPERQLRFLIALETVTRGEGSWRKVETGVLARLAGRSVRMVVKARAELAASSRIYYRPGTGPGHPGRYRLLVDVDKPPANAGRVKPTTDAARVKPTTDVARVDPCNPAPGSRATGSQKPAPPNAVTSANASISLEPITLEPSTLPRAPARPRDPLTLLDGLGVDDERLREHIIGWLDEHADDPYAYLLAIIGNGPGEVRNLLGRMSRELAALDGADPRPAKPPWCGECDERTRLVGMDGDQPTRCIRCHPLSVARPDPAGA